MIHSTLFAWALCAAHTAHTERRGVGAVFVDVTGESTRNVRNHALAITAIQSDVAAVVMSVAIVTLLAFPKSIDVTCTCTRSINAEPKRALLVGPALNARSSTSTDAIDAIRGSVRAVSVHQTLDKISLSRHWHTFPVFIANHVIVAIALVTTLRVA